MSVDHSTSAASPVQNRPQFLDVRSGNFVIVRAPREVIRAENDNWWMGRALCCEGEAQTSTRCFKLQMSMTVQSGGVNADEVIHILHLIDGLFD